MLADVLLSFFRGTNDGDEWRARGDHPLVQLSHDRLSLSRQSSLAPQRLSRRASARATVDGGQRVLVVGEP